MIHFNRTVKDLLEEWKYSAPGFDALRLILASLIILWHSAVVCIPESSKEFALVWKNPFFHPILKAILPMFFFLSGFLVSSSAYRLRSTGIFLAHRAFRIVPALLVEVLFSAVVLGAMFSTLSTQAYFNDSQFYRYFLNLIGNIQFYLPGVFSNHPSPIVNVNLWTLPAEFECYLLMSFLMLTKIIFHRWKMTTTVLLLSSALLYFCITRWNWGDSGHVFVRGPLLTFSFLIGVFVFVASDRVYLNKFYFFISIVGLNFLTVKYTITLGVLCACYACLCIGFADLRKFPLIRHGDFSYGMYLYSFPIQQSVWHFFPAARVWWGIFLISYPTTLIFALFSWRFVEKPFLNLKRHIVLYKTSR